MLCLMQIIPQKQQQQHYHHKKTVGLDMLMMMLVRFIPRYIGSTPAMSLAGRFACRRNGLNLVENGQQKIIS
jgi:hypothetical protein